MHANQRISNLSKLNDIFFLAFCFWFPLLPVSYDLTFFTNCLKLFFLQDIFIFSRFQFHLTLRRIKVKLLRSHIEKIYFISSEEYGNVVRAIKCKVNLCSSRFFFCCLSDELTGDGLHKKIEVSSTKNVF